MNREECITHDKFSWFKNMYEQLKNKDSCNGDDIGLYKELLGHTSQDIDKLDV